MASNDISYYGPGRYIGIGFALLVLGGVFMVVALPSGYDDGFNGPALFIGGLLMAIGQLLALIGVVAQGVKVGNLSSEELLRR